MKEQLKKADVFGLILVGSALIAYFLRNTWSHYQTGVFAVGCLLIAVSLFLKSSEIREGMGRRSTKFGINSGISILLFIGVLALVNYLGERHPKRFDMTTERRHSLSDESVKVAGEVKEAIAVKAFYPGADEPALRQLLDLYSGQNRSIAVEFIDPDKNPQAAQQYQVSEYGISQDMFGRPQGAFGTVILDMGGGKIERIEKKDAVTEEDVTNSITKLLKWEKKTIYFVGGHGEKGAESTERDGYQVANGALTKDGYAVKVLNLVREQKVPADASAVVMPGPTSEPFPQEMDALDGYLNGGGSMLLMLDPAPGATLKDFMQKWSVAPGSNRIIDPSGVGQLFGMGPDIPLVTNFGTHKVVDRFNNSNVMTFFPVARSVAPAEPPVPGLTVEPIIESSGDSWGESDLTSNKVGFDPKADAKGPVPIAVAVTKDVSEGKKARLLVFGDSDFAINANFSNGGNGNLFTNAVKWLARDENFIAIKAKSPQDRPLTLTESGGRTIFFVVVVLLPGAVLVAGVAVWAKRRK